MNLPELFTTDFAERLEESVRIDRERDVSLQSSTHPLQTYQITNEASVFLVEFFEHLLGHGGKMRKGTCHWLYGYFGSGKSHLLTVLNFLTDIGWIEQFGSDRVWDALTNDGTSSEDLETLHQLWSNTLEKYRVIPVSVNLLKYQGIEDRSFSDIVLEAAHRRQNFSSRLEVAYFEKWYRTTPSWGEKKELVQEILQTKGIENASQFTWEDVRNYQIISDILLPALFKRETGTTDGLDDLKREPGPDEVVKQLEEWRKKEECHSEREVKLVLLLDEVSLFIGDDFDKLTELNALAERVEEIGGGDIQMVATAQEKIEEVQPEYAAKSAEMNILKDRFPHRYSLPSRHAGEIVQRRLLTKTETGCDWVNSNILKNARLRPEDAFVYADVGRNTSPGLDQIDESEFIKFYPFLPYLPPLCLEILSGLREEAADSAKSIFSGTARAILAIANGLLADWVRKGEEYELVNLVDFYDLIEREIKDISPQKVKVIEEIERDVEEGDLEGIDLDVAKVVLLLRHVPEFIPLSPENIAVSVMRDLNGPTRTRMIGRIGDSLNRLDKYVRSDGEDVSQLRFTELEERQIYATAEEFEDNPNWKEIVEQVDIHLIEDVMARLSLPDSTKYRGDEDRYPVLYEFKIADQQLSTQYGDSEGLRVPITIRGLLPEEEGISKEESGLNWFVGDEGIEELRDRLVDWWSLLAAGLDREIPPTVKRDLDKRADLVKDGLSSTLKSGSYKVREKTPTKLEDAVKECVSETYPETFHPVMLEVDQTHLGELADLGRGDPLPSWAEKLQIPTESPETHRGGNIQTGVRAMAGRTLEEHEGELSISRLLELITEDQPAYEQVEMSLSAILWGLCRKGDFRPVDEEGNPVTNDVLLNPDLQAETRLRIAKVGEDFRQLLEKHGFLGSTDPNDAGLVNLRDTNQSLAQSAKNLVEDIHLLQEDLTQNAVRNLASSFEGEIREFRKAAQTRSKLMDSNDPDWEKITSETAEAQDWLDDVQERWNLRTPHLLQLDGLLNLVHQSLSWVSNDCSGAGNDLKEKIENCSELRWWTEDGWQRFVSIHQDSRNSVLENLRGAWDDFIKKNKIYELVDELENHLWIIPPRKLPTTLYPGLERKYLRPLRQFKSAYSDSSEGLEALFADLTSIEKYELESALQIIKSSDLLTKLEESSIPELTEKMELLNKVVGNRAPNAVTAVGIWPEDEKSLQADVENSVKEYEIEINRVKGGIILQ